MHFAFYKARHLMVSVPCMTPLSLPCVWLAFSRDTVTSFQSPSEPLPGPFPPRALGGGPPRGGRARRPAPTFCPLVGLPLAGGVSAARGKVSPSSRLRRASSGQRPLPSQTRSRGLRRELRESAGRQRPAEREDGAATAAPLRARGAAPGGPRRGGRVGVRGASGRAGGRAGRRGRRGPPCPAL